MRRLPLVEDDTELSELLTETLRDEGCEVDQTPDGRCGDGATFTVSSPATTCPGHGPPLSAHAG